MPKTEELMQPDLSTDANGEVGSSRDDSGLLILPLTLLAPNFTLALWVLVVGVAEALLLATVTESIYSTAGPGALQVPLGILCFWYHMVWILWLPVKAGGHLKRRLPTLAGRALDGLVCLVLVGLAALYAGSWAMYFRTGRFADAEAIRFAWMNSGEPWLALYLAGSETPYVIGLGLACLIGLAASPWWLHAMRQDGWSCRASVAPERLRIARLVLWLTIIGALSGLTHLRQRITDARQYSAWQEAVRNRFNPAVTATLTSVRFALLHRIEPVLAPAKLKRITDEAWQIPSSEAPRPSIIFIAIESLRNDVIHLRHQDREVMPHVNQLARRGIEFTHAYAQSTHLGLLRRYDRFVAVPVAYAMAPLLSAHRSVAEDIDL